MRILKNLTLVIVVLVLAATALVYGLSTYRMRQTVAVVDPSPLIPTDSARIAHGQYLVRAIVKCADCHGPDLGGHLFIDGGPLGVINAPNLTSGAGGLGTVRADSDLVLAIRHAVGPGGRKLLFMPSEGWAGMADTDVSDIVAYLRTIPRVDRTMAASTLGPLGRALYVTGQLPLYEAEFIQHDQISRQRPAAGVTTEYGRYVSNIGGCTGCHGPTLSGGHVPGTPPSFKPASNLTPEGIGHYTEADFFRAMREGKRPNGTALDPFMPVGATKYMTDEDTRAVLAFLRSVPSKPYGGR